MIYSTLTLALLGAAAAGPVQPRAVPRQDIQQGYNLFVNVTDLSRDFKDHPVHGSGVSMVHIGADQNAFIPFDKTRPVPDKADFYDDDLSVQAAVSGPVPYGLVQSIDKETNRHYLFINAGEGTMRFGSDHYESLPSDEPCAKLHGPNIGHFAVCDNGFDAYAHPRYTIDYFEVVTDLGDHYIPDNCVPANLLPECAPLDLSEATYPVGYMPKSLCYLDKVNSIQWSKYPQCA